MRLTEAEVAEIRVNVMLAHDMVTRLCNRRTTGQEWIMHVPARPDSDPDLVIGRGLGCADKLLADRDALVAQLAECFRLSGADPDGDEDWRLAPRAVEEVRRLREESDAESKRDAAEIARLLARVAELEEVERAARKVREIAALEPRLPGITHIVWGQRYDSAVVALDAALDRAAAAKETT